MLILRIETISEIFSFLLKVLNFRVSLTAEARWAKVYASEPGVESSNPCVNFFFFFLNFNL